MNEMNESFVLLLFKLYKNYAWTIKINKTNQAGKKYRDCPGFFTRTRCTAGLKKPTTFLSYKISEELVTDPRIIQAVIDSNAKFTAIDYPYQYTNQKDIEWKKQPKNQNSPLINALSENAVSDILKSNMKITTEEFGDILFPELIVTNAYGANVAITGRTDDYNQGDESWWLKAKDRVVQFRDTSWDESAGIFSADIIVQIVDSNGVFIGVLNAATPIK